MRTNDLWSQRLGGEGIQGEREAKEKGERETRRNNEVAQVAPCEV